jgi:hypothetical protein
MARKPKLEAISNGYDTDVLRGLLAQIDKHDAELVTFKASYMSKCKGPRGALATVFENAAEAGLPKKGFRTLVKNHRLSRKIADNVDRLEDDDHDTYQRLVADLGDFIDLPLGKAAAERAQRRDEGWPGAA